MTVLQTRVRFMLLIGLSQLTCTSFHFTATYAHPNHDWARLLKPLVKEKYLRHTLRMIIYSFKVICSLEEDLSAAKIFPWQTRTPFNRLSINIYLASYACNACLLIYLIYAPV